MTLAQFLHENPATPHTQICRVSAINYFHDRAGLAAPGRITAIRTQLNTRRAARLTHLHGTAEHALRHIPTVGWPHGLFGRRDAALLVFTVYAGLSFHAVSRLRRSDIDSAAGELFIGGMHQVRVESRSDRSVCPVQLFQQWAQILDFTDRHPSTRLLARHLSLREDGEESRRGEPVVPGSRRDGPLFTPIDRWGYLPLIPEPLSAAAIAQLVRARLNGTAAPHVLPPRSQTRLERDLREDTEAPESSESSSASTVIELEHEYYTRGIAARQHTFERMRTVDDLLDDVETKADQLLERTLEILERYG
ncbi:hypothetical protein [Rhodococcus sp. PSBB049]|uniref:hypothetical protein n=1 Tax=Rhodococcus sp. PSBB049 TaxID=2812863 RepID=UPI00197CF41D|nr:hypothetical protein [Rhodococcus sp. PSBB049]QSE72343.1 hypothetical protein JYA91_28760 [Rhodococcus sp. PSBB049]